MVIRGVSGLVTCGHGVLRVVNLIICTYMCYCMYEWFVVPLCEVDCGYICSCMACHQGSNPIGLWSGHKFQSLSIMGRGTFLFLFFITVLSI